MNTKTRMEKFEKVLCANCMQLKEYEIKTEREIRNVNGRDYEFNKKIAVCNECGNRVMVPGLEDENEACFERIYRKENNYIQIDKIKQLVEKYKRENRSLSKELGVSEHVIEKYLEGQLPNRACSELLMKL